MKNIKKSKHMATNRKLFKPPPPKAPTTLAYMQFFTEVHMLEDILTSCVFLKMIAFWFKQILNAI